MIYCDTLSYNIKFSSLIIFFSFILKANTQGNSQLGMLPSINLSRNFSKDLVFISEIEFRQALQEEPFSGNYAFKYDYIHTDVSAIIANINQDGNTMGAGYLIRLKSIYLLHRFIQFYTIDKEYVSFEMDHRFTSDQSLEYKKNPNFRFRYRIGFKFILSQRAQNPKKVYFKFYNEYVNIFNRDGYDLELRAIPMLSYEYASNQELEFGIDYRIKSFINTSLEEQRFWITLNWGIIL